MRGWSHDTTRCALALNVINWYPMHSIGKTTPNVQSVDLWYHLVRCLLRRYHLAYGSDVTMPLPVITACWSAWFRAYSSDSRAFSNSYKDIITGNSIQCLTAIEPSVRAACVAKSYRVSFRVTWANMPYCYLVLKTLAIKMVTLYT